MASSTPGDQPPARLSSRCRRRSRRRHALGVLAGAGLLVGMMSASGSATVAPGYSVVASFPVRYDPHGVAVDPARHKIYVTDDASYDIPGSLSVVDTDTGTLTAKIPVGDDPYGVAADPSNHHVYVVNGEGTVSVIDESGDVESGTVTATVAVGYQPEAVAVDPSTHDVYVTADSDRPDGISGGLVSVIDESGDAHSGRVIATIPVGGVEPDGVAVDPSTHTVYVASRNDTGPGVVSVIDESGDARTGTVTAIIPVGIDPLGVAVDPTRATFYVANFGAYGTNGSVSVIDESGDAESGRVVATRPIPQHPYGVAVDPSNHNLYVTSSDYADSGILSVIDESGDAGTGRVTAALGLGGAVVDVAVDPSTHGIWVAADESLLEIASRAPADVGLSLRGPTSAVDGSQFAEKVTVTNHGPVTAERTVTNLEVPAGLSVSAAPGATLRGGTLVWDDLTLGDGASVSHTVTFAVAADVHATEAIGGATICTAAYDPDPADNVAVTSIRLG